MPPAVPGAVGIRDGCAVLRTTVATVVVRVMGCKNGCKADVGREEGFQLEVSEVLLLE